mgnify:CR=1 FL=1
MWIGIPTLSRPVKFCIVASIIYMIVSFPEMKDFIGHYTSLSKHDDIESNDRYYLVIIHSLLFGCLVYVVLYLYPLNISMNMGKLPNLLKQTKIKK